MPRAKDTPLLAHWDSNANSNSNTTENPLPHRPSLSSPYLKFASQHSSEHSSALALPSLRKILSQSKSFYFLLFVNLILSICLIRSTHPDAKLSTSLSELIASATNKSLSLLSSQSSSALLAQNLGTQSCELCVLNASDPLCVYGLDSIRMSRSYEGSGYRVRRFLEKAIRGEDVKIGVVGASISLGHGVVHLGKPIWHQVFIEDFKKAFPDITVTVEYGMAGGMGSDFFARCFKTLLPDDLDLYFIELDVNNDASDDALKADDGLFRALLNLPQQPAVVRISVVALLFYDMYRGALPAQIQAQYFDVPIINIRNSMLPYFLLHPDDTKRWFTLYEDGKSDTRHISWIGHQMLGDMTSLYFREQICEAKRRAINPPLPAAEGWPQEDILGYVPRMHLWTQFNSKTKVAPVTPSCWSAGSTTYPLAPIAFTGDWHIEKWNDKAAWEGSLPGTSATFEFEGTSVGAFIWETNGKGYKNEPGIAIFYIDRATEHQVAVDAYNTRSNAGSEWYSLFQNLRPGRHNLTCLILPETSTKGHDFRILGIGGL